MTAIRGLYEADLLSDLLSSMYGVVRLTSRPLNRRKTHPPTQSVTTKYTPQMVAAVGLAGGDGIQDRARILPYDVRAPYEF